MLPSTDVNKLTYDQGQKQMGTGPAAFQHLCPKSFPQTDLEGQSMSLAHPTSIMQWYVQVPWKELIPFNTDQLLVNIV
jgi:hypothetical protein